ncbi:MAG: DUF2950 domain-containing protein [Bryobacteraceae bacterium]
MARMKTIYLKDLPLGRILFAAAGLMIVAVLLHAAPPPSQRTFATPREAIQATIDAAEQNDTAALLQIFGPAGKDIIESGDPAQDKDHRAEFASSAREKLQIEEDLYTPDRVTFAVGADEWPFPVALIQKDGKWQFDSASGRIEILARRIGRNELNAMDVCRGYAEAQLEYAAQAHDGDPILKYAQRIVSTPGKQDGLYSVGVADTLVSKAFAEAAAARQATVGKAPEPYHGYYFRMLKSQGPDAAGGAFDYLVNGKMIGGFALVAWPAEYGVSGIGTFIINHDGVVYEKDLPADDAVQSRQILASGGRRVESLAIGRRQNCAS